MSFIHYPMIGPHIAGFFSWFFQNAIGKGNIFVRNSHINFLSSFLIRFVYGRKPGWRIFWFSICPDLRRMIFICALRINKIQAFCRAPPLLYYVGSGCVFYINRIILIPVICFIKIDGKNIILVIIFQRNSAFSFIYGYFMNQHSFCIQH